jgi:hypothetical protein
MPIPGVSVLVKGTKFGTQTDFDGKYAINASPSQILHFQLRGHENPRIKSDVITCKHNDGWEQQRTDYNKKPKLFVRNRKALNRPKPIRNNLDPTSYVQIRGQTPLREILNPCM